MKTIFYKTDSAIFQFDQTDVNDCLNFYASQHNIDKAIILLNILNQSEDTEIHIPEDNPYFGFIVLDFLSQNKGSAFCKTCQESYTPDQLKLIPIGHGSNPFSVNIDQKRCFFKRFFRRNKKLPGMRGGKGYECPQGHELISKITWMT